MKIEDALLLLEATLINEERPEYIEVSEQAGFIFILLSKKEYKDIPLHERILRITSLLEFEHDDILDQYPVIVECYDDQQFTDLLKSWKDINDESE